MRRKGEPLPQPVPRVGFLGHPTARPTTLGSWPNLERLEEKGKGWRRREEALGQGKGWNKGGKGRI